MFSRAHLFRGVSVTNCPSPARCEDPVALQQLQRTFDPQPPGSPRVGRDVIGEPPTQTRRIHQNLLVPIRFHVREFVTVHQQCASDSANSVARNMIQQVQRKGSQKYQKSARLVEERNCRVPRQRYSVCFSVVAFLLFN